MWKFLLAAILFSVPFIWLGTNKPVLLAAIITLALSLIIHIKNLTKYLVILLLVFLPISLDLSFDFLNGSKIGMPSEALIILLSIITLLRYIENPGPLKILKKSAVFYSIIVFIGVLILTSFTSEMQEVSFKFTVVNGLYIVTGFGLLFHLFSTQELKLKELLIPVYIGFTGVFIVFIMNILEYGLGRNTAHILPNPFFNDHTIYGATLVLLFPFLFYAYLKVHERLTKNLCATFVLVFLLCIYFSYSRASWLSIVFITLVLAFLYFRLNWSHLTIGLSIVGVLLYLNWQTVENAFYTNSNDSSRIDSSLIEQVQSITNISSDVSNEERINRWKCALRMGSDKPKFGYGPGTYQFKYLPYQRKNEMTQISVKSVHYIKAGHGGTAHGEYLLSFAESGYLGVLSWLALIGTVVYTFVKALNKRNFGGESALMITCFLALISFFFHACFNNFLNSANFGIYFWIILAVFVFDSTIKPKEKNNEKNN